MKTKLTPWGNSFGLRIPRKIRDALRLSPGDTVEMQVRDGRLIITPKRQDTLDDLLDLVMPENRHGEFGWGPDVGLERQ